MPKSGFSELARQASLQPQEQMLESKKKKGALKIGVPRETTFQENRVVLTPSSIELLVANGHEVVVESGAGKGANFTDREYSEAGAQIASSQKEVYACQVIVKVDPPTMEEIDLMQPGQLLISAVQFSALKAESIQALMKKKVHAVGYELTKDRAGTYPIVRSMSEIAGNTSILIAAEYLSASTGGKGEMLGGVAGIPPTEVVIIGAGTVGEYAARAALGLGASVKVFDNSLYKLRRMQHNIGERVATAILNPKILSKALMHCDVAVGALRSNEGLSPCVVTDQMVASMKPGSIVVDVSIDHGGCFETSHVTTHTDPVYRIHDVIHYCVPNINSRVPRTASYALSNVLTPMLLHIAEAGGFTPYLWDAPHRRHGVYIYSGYLTNQAIGQRFGIVHKEIDLLVAVS